MVVNTCGYTAMIVLCLNLLACSETTDPPSPSESVAKPEVMEPEGDPVAIVETSKGNIVIKLLPELAPKSVAQFIQLAEAGFYMRTAFHFVSRNMIWGGDPYSKDNDPSNDGSGNSGIWLEPELDDSYSVDRGSVGFYQHLPSPSASCQFFITLRRRSDWDGQYNIFGNVIEGMDVVDAISTVPTMDGRDVANMPTAKQLIRRINIEYRKFEDAVEDAAATG